MPWRARRCGRTGARMRWSAWCPRPRRQRRAACTLACRNGCRNPARCETYEHHPSTDVELLAAAFMLEGSLPVVITARRGWRASKRSSLDALRCGAAVG
jgi:hypothetical protein